MKSQYYKVDASPSPEMNRRGQSALLILGMSLILWAGIVALIRAAL